LIRNGTTSSREPDRFPSIFLIVFALAFSSFPMIIGELDNQGGAYSLRFLGLYLSGICITVTLAIFLGNMTGTHSPTFIDSCKPNPSIQELCKAAVEGVRTYVKVNCTTSANREWPSFISYRASSFPLVISLMGYFTTGFFLWSMVLSSKERREACGCRLFASFVAVIGMICMGCAAYFQLEAFFTDIVTGFALGFVVAVMYVGMMVIMYPKWRKHSILQDLPFTKYDLSQVKKDDTTASSASSVSSKGENEKKPPAIEENSRHPHLYPPLV